jgi:hypothetical protein
VELTGHLCPVVAELGDGSSRPCPRIDGREPGISEGATLQEAAELTNGLGTLAAEEGIAVPTASVLARHGTSGQFCGESVLVQGCDDGGWWLITLRTAKDEGVPTGTLIDLSPHSDSGDLG